MVTICFVVGSVTLNIYVIVVSALCFVDYFFSRHLETYNVIRYSEELILPETFCWSSCSFCGIGTHCSIFFSCLITHNVFSH